MTQTPATGNSECLAPPAMPCALPGMRNKEPLNSAKIAELLASDRSPAPSLTSFRSLILQSLTEHPNLPIIVGGLKLCLLPSTGLSGDTSFLVAIDAQRGILSACRVKNLKENP